MIAIDTNILVYAHRPDFAQHRAAAGAIERVLAQEEAVSLPFHCVVEFMAVVTRARLFNSPSTPADATHYVESLLARPRVALVHDTPPSLARLTELVRTHDLTGPRIYDARIAAVCVDAGVDVIWSADRDMQIFRPLRVVNPLH